MAHNINIDMMITRSFDIEITTKYFYICLLMEMGSQDKNPFVISADELSFNCGLSKGRIYRARSQLVDFGVLKLTKKFCPDTGKRTEDIYEMI
jgi:hypothetical protein